MWNYGQEGPQGTITFKSEGPGPNFRFLNSDVNLAGTTSLVVQGSGAITPGSGGFTPNVATAFTSPAVWATAGGTSTGWLNFNSRLTTNQSTDGKTAQSNLTFSGLTADYAGDIAAWDATTTSDTSSFNYTGKLRGGMGHVIIQTSGGTVTFTEGFAGVVRVNPGAVGTMTGGYGTSGELLHDSIGAYAITSFNSLQGTQVITGAGTIGTGIAVNGLCNLAAGSTGNFTTQAQAVFGQVYHQNAQTIPLAQGVNGTVRTDTAAGVFTAADGIAGQLQHGGSGILPSVAAIRAMSPIFTGAGTVTNKYGLRVNNQGNALITTSYGISIDAQSGSASANFAIRTQGGKHSFQTAAADQTGFVITDGTTNYVSIDSRTTTNAVSGITFDQADPTVTTAGNATYHLLTLNAYTLTFSGTSTPSNVNGMALNILAPTITNSQAQTSTAASTVCIAGPPIAAGSAVITNPYALAITTGNVLFGGLLTTYNNIAVGGNGVGSLVKYTRPAQQSASTVTLATYTTPAADGSYRVWVNVNVTTAGSLNMTVTCAYTDESNVARTLTIPFLLLAGTLVQSITSAQGTIAYESIPITIRTKASTSITLATAGTVTGGVYTGEGFIEQVA